MPMPAPNTYSSPRRGTPTRTTGAQPRRPRGPGEACGAAMLRGARSPRPGRRGASRRRGSRCAEAPRDIAAGGRRPHRHRGTGSAPSSPAIPGGPFPPSLPPHRRGPAPTGRAPPGRSLPADPASSPRRRAVRHRPSPAPPLGGGRGRGHAALPRSVTGTVTAPQRARRSAPLRSPQPGGGSGGPCRWEQARRAAPSPLRAQPPPNRSARRVPAGAAAAVAEGAAVAVARGVAGWVSAARPPRLGGDCPTVTAGLGDRPFLAFHRAAGRLPGWQQAFPQSRSRLCPGSSRRPPPREREPVAAAACSLRGETWWLPVPRVGGCTLKCPTGAEATKARGRENGTKKKRPRFTCVGGGRCTRPPPAHLGDQEGNKRCPHIKCWKRRGSFIRF